MRVSSAEFSRSRNVSIDRRHKRLIGIRMVGAASAFAEFWIIVAAAVVSAFVYHAVFLRGTADVGRYAAIGAICFINFVAIGAARHSYKFDVILRSARRAREVSLTWALVSMLSLSLLFVAKAGGEVSRGAVVLFLLTGWFAILAWRRVFGNWIARAIQSGALAGRRVILITDQAEFDHAERARQLKDAGYVPALTLKYQPDSSQAHIRELVAAASRIAAEEPINLIMLAANWCNAGAIDQMVAALQTLPLAVHLLPDRHTGHFVQGVRNAGPGLVIAELRRAPLTEAERTAKRVFDLALATLGIVLILPIFVVVAALIKLDSRGPIFFLQNRNGFSGKAFRILKFRTMHVEGDDCEFRQATRADPRITRVGRLLRRTSIDELPQLWNVIKGDMSIVGPRPHPTALDAEYQRRIGTYAFRHHVKPGLTGWAQVHGLRGETKTIDRMQRRIDHDLYYINNWSFLLDLLIVFKTLRVVIYDPAAF